MSIFFDLESTGLSVNSDDIVCAVTKKGDEIICWREEPTPKRFTPDLAHKLALYLINDGSSHLCTFNGLAFDVPILLAHMEDPVLQLNLVKLALYNHVDIFYDFLTSVGYRTSLNSFLQNTDFQKPMSGEDAAALVRFF